MIAGMSDTPRDAPARATGIPVYDAAHLLGISENAVRARLRRGTLVGVKNDTSWSVLLRDTDIPMVTPSIKSDAPPRVPSHTAVHTDLIEELRADKRYLQSQLDRALRQLEAERQRVDVLHALGAGATPGASPNASGSPVRGETGPQGLWGRVRRLWRG